MSKGIPRGPAFWALLAGSTAAVGGFAAALAVIWVYGRPRALLERARERAGGDGTDPGLIRQYGPSDFGSVDEGGWQR